MKYRLSYRINLKKWLRSSVNLKSVTQGATWALLTILFRWGGLLFKITKDTNTNKKILALVIKNNSIVEVLFYESRFYVMLDESIPKINVLKSENECWK